MRYGTYLSSFPYHDVILIYGLTFQHTSEALATTLITPSATINLDDILTSLDALTEGESAGTEEAQSTLQPLGET